MQAKGVIQIQGKQYQYQFKMKARRLFMELYGLEYMDEYEKKVQEMIPKKGKSMSLSAWYIFANLLRTAIQSETEEALEFTADDLLDELMNDQSKLNQIMKNFQINQEQKQPNKKNNSVGSGKSKARK
ncbi:hypothetical protein [Aquimarina sp. Aq78]|uniref:hypothetical protein n=1 Tax=Aquimarina sp. Aq78 TaxID=1191889 RepID=UPI000D0E3B6E|nr:hypothetical protein [Aquimarina sp. Aq78]